MKIHRAIVLVVMMLMAAGLIVLFTATGIASLDAHSLIALGVVLLSAAISGAAFSWKRYLNPREVRTSGETSREPQSHRP